MQLPSDVCVLNLFNFTNLNLYRASSKNDSISLVGRNPINLHWSIYLIAISPHPKCQFNDMVM